MKADSLNVFGEALLICGTAPITGAYAMAAVIPVLLMQEHIPFVQW